MQIGVQAAVPVLYVRAIESARDFYELFGYREAQTGGDNDARWSYLQCGEHTLLLASVQPPLFQAELPLLVYLYVFDLQRVQQRLEEVGRPYEVVGRPDHAPGGEIRVHDPDGNVVLVGQRSPRTGTAAPVDPATRSSLIRQAAEALSRRGDAPASCQIGAPDGGSCSQPAEVKLADTWGVTVWGCLTHAEEALINAPAAFIAAENDQGLGPWLSRRTPGAP
ncbi:VOC family protein [Actinoplanes sp. URMC 104]|uniref:VOC family protein n=1 Tax=Actinoplanes sp. URMC 104 TaxID=3423409 RepID=UPI003F1E0D14